jgi:choline kinase
MEDRVTGVILAAGIGNRLGSSIPKGLLELPSGETILSRQVRIMKASGIDGIVVVVGFKKEMIEQALTGVRFVTNPRFAVTNTAKSLLCALESINDDVLWVNGDVVFDEDIIPQVVAQKDSTILVNSARCGEEEVKYRADGDGTVKQISKQLTEADGEALGVNMIRRVHLPGFVASLRRCDDRDYFERAMQDVIDRGVVFKRLLVDAHRCIEVDFKEDWERAQQMFRPKG